MQDTPKQPKDTEQYCERVIELMHDNYRRLYLEHLSRCAGDCPFCQWEMEVAGEPTPKGDRPC